MAALQKILEAAGAPESAGKLVGAHSVPQGARSGLGADSLSNTYTGAQAGAACGAGERRDGVGHCEERSPAGWSGSGCRNESSAAIVRALGAAGARWATLAAARRPGAGSGTLERSAGPPQCELPSPCPLGPLGELHAEGPAMLRAGSERWARACLGLFLHQSEEEPGRNGAGQ